MHYTTTYLLLGSNLGDKIENIENAIRLLSLKTGNIIKESSYYITDAWGFETENLFINKAISINTKLSPKTLLSEIHSIEKSIGRTRKEGGYASRVIDIDIIYYGDLILNTEELIIPHPRMQERKFVLKPLSEICSLTLHPIIKKTNQEIYDECKDELNVSIITP